MIGSQIREYKVLKLLGEGGMGAVYLAEHTILNRQRAIKLLHPELTRHPSVVQRFLNEARAVAKLAGSDGKPHRNIVQVYELFQENGTWFMVMEFLEGATLSRAIARGPMPLDRVVHAVGGIANALKLAHANGIIHRDLKPDNVFITVRENDRFHVVLLDFGVAQLRNDLQSGPETKAGTLIGTPHFMAPEQLAGRPITDRTDIFALGILTYMMVTGGRHPWQYEDTSAFYALREPELYVRMTQQHPVDPRRYVPTLTDEQTQVLLAPLAVDPARRPASAAAYAIALAERVPTDGIHPDGLEVLRTRYSELLEIDNLSETVRGPRPASIPSLSSSGLESKYKLVRKLGAGGMAEVYLATTLGVEGFSRPVAIKRIFSGVSESATFAKLFIREAQITARLSHPNIVSVLDFSRDPQDRLFLVMEYVDGKDLATLLEAGPLSPSLAIFVATEILRGLGYAHGLADPSGSLSGHGVVHRDMSPHNVLLSHEGAVKVCDFGLARALAASNTSSNAPAGKPAYMSPEQVRSAPDLDGRADLFAVGIMLWEMLTGQRLFSGSFTETMAQVIHKDIAPPSTVRAGVPQALDAIVLRLLARARAERYQRAEEAVRDLLGSGVASADGRGELVSTLGARFPRSGGATPAGALASAGPNMAMFSTVSASPALPIPQSTLGAAASESAVRIPETRPRGIGFAIAALASVAVGAIVVLVIKSRSDGQEAGNSETTVAATRAVVDAASSGGGPVAGTADAAPRTTNDDALLGAPPPADASTSPVDAHDAGVTNAPPADAGNSPAPAPIVDRSRPRANGILSVSCDPWCEIWIDGVKRASTVSKRFTLAVGVHKVRLVHPDFKEQFTKNVTITDTPTIIEQNW